MVDYITFSVKSNYNHASYLKVNYNPCILFILYPTYFFLITTNKS